MDVVEPSVPKGMKLDHEKTLAQEPRQLRDFSGDTLTEPSEVSSTPQLPLHRPEANYHQLPQSSTFSGLHGPSDPISKKEGQIATTPNVNSCQPHRSYQYIRSIKPKKCVNVSQHRICKTRWSYADRSQVNTRFGHRNGCLLCMFHVDHSGVLKPVHAQDVAPTVIEPQKLEEGPLEPEHTPQEPEVKMSIKDEPEHTQEPEVEMSTNDEPDAKAPQEVKSPNIEDLAKQETPSVKDNAGDESSDKSPVIDLQSPIESPQPEHSAEDNDAKAQNEDAISEDGKAVDGEDNKIEDIHVPDSQLYTGPASTLHPTEDHTQDPANQTTSDDCKLIDDTSSTEEELSSAEDEEKHTIPSEQKDVVTQEPPADAPVQTEGQKDENDIEANKKNVDDTNAIAQEHLVPEEEGTGLGHAFPILNPEHNPEPLENPLESDTDAEEQNATVIPEPSADGPVQTEEEKDEDNAKANMKKMDEANAVALESFVPEEEGTALGHVFPFANLNYEPESLENPHDVETYNMEQKDVVTPERPADVPAKTEERKDEISTSERNMGVLALINKKKADDPKTVALESFAPEEEGTRLGHVFPFLNPNWAPEPLDNPHDVEVSAKVQKEIDMEVEVPKKDLATSSETNNEDTSDAMPHKGNDESVSKDASNNETSTVEPAQEHKHSGQKAPFDSEKNDNVEEVIPPNDEKGQTPVELLHSEEQGTNENDIAPDAQTLVKVQDLENGSNEPASKPDTESAPGEAILEVGEELDSESHVPNGGIDEPFTKVVSGDPGLHLALPFRTKSEMAGATAADTTANHTNAGEGNDQPDEENAGPEDKNAQHDENESRNVEEIKEIDSMSPLESSQPAKNLLPPEEHDPEPEHTSVDSSENKQHQQPSPSVKEEDSQSLTEQLQESSATQPQEVIETISLGEPDEPALAVEVVAPESSSGGSEYESFNDDDDTHGEDNLISQAVSNLRHETLNDRLIDRLVEDPERVGEIIAASFQTEEEEEFKGSENLSNVPEDLALSDENSIPELKLSEPVTSTDKDETLNQPPHADEGNNQKSAAGDDSQHDMLHDRLASSLAEDSIGVSEMISAESGEVGGLTVDLLAPSVQASTNDAALPTLIFATLDKTEGATDPEDDNQGHQQPASTVGLEIEDEPKAKLTETASPPLETEAPIELATTTSTVPTPTKSQQRRAQANRAKERKAAERAAAASQDHEPAITASAAADKSEKKGSGKTTMTKRQIKRARQTRAKQRRLEAEKSSTQ